MYPLSSVDAVAIRAGFHGRIADPGWAEEVITVIILVLESVIIMQETYNIDIARYVVLNGE